MSKKIFVGVDGCRRGWFAVFLAAENSQYSEWETGLFPSFLSLIDFLKMNYGQAEPLILIDIPIGLKKGGYGERLSDIKARGILKARKSSIFPVPCREAVYAENYEKACEINKKFTGKSISRQAWNIIPKIRDVDAFLAKNEVFKEKVKETSPEVCFQEFTGFPMKHPKRSQRGFSERMKALKSICLDADKIADSALSRYRRKDVSKDDILDALAAAITAKMGQRYGFQYVPDVPEKDSEGLNIQMVFCNSTNNITNNLTNNSTKNLSRSLTIKSIDMEFILIPAGEFDMGSPIREKRRKLWESPVHRVSIGKPFYLARYPVTQKQWQRVMGNNPSYFKGEKHPVENVSWNEIQVFFRKLNTLENAGENYQIYRLPTEAEWEYAARAGTATAYFFGDDESELRDYAWFLENSGLETHPVGLKNPNPWGLYDIYGNVGEWVQDEYHISYKDAPADGRAWENSFPSVSTPVRIRRGGGWNGNAGSCRSAERLFAAQDKRLNSLGFRVVREV